MKFCNENKTLKILSKLNNYRKKDFSFFFSVSFVHFRIIALTSTMLLLTVLLRMYNKL